MRHAQVYVTQTNITLILTNIDVDLKTFLSDRKQYEVNAVSAD